MRVYFGYVCRVFFNGLMYLGFIALITLIVSIVMFSYRF